MARKFSESEKDLVRRVLLCATTRRRRDMSVTMGQIREAAHLLFGREIVRLVVKEGWEHGVGQSQE